MSSHWEGAAAIHPGHKQRSIAVWEGQNLKDETKQKTGLCHESVSKLF